MVISLSNAQEKHINWLTFEELEKTMLDNPKKVMILFNADWCEYCKKMERDVFPKMSVKKELIANYHVVKFNVESQDTIKFGGQTFFNSDKGKQRIAYHDLAKLLASNKNEVVTLPATLFFNRNFELRKRILRYISPKEMITILKE